MYLHRYLRLTPILAIAILFYMKILPLWESGPLKGSISFDDYSACESTWYWTLLYVQNYATDSLVGSFDDDILYHLISPTVSRSA